MLDEITYTKDDVTGEILKQVVQIDAVDNCAREITALEAQLSDIEAGQRLEPSQEASDAIINYREQIANLKLLTKAG